MSIQPLTKDDIWSEEFAATRDFLARFGIAPREVSQYVEEDVLRAIRHKGWEPNIEREGDPPGWKAEIQEWRTVSQSRSAIARDRNRMMALLRALRIALTWSTAEEDYQAFDDETHALLGISATEFLERLESNDLPLDDPRVVHLVVARPLGW
jgi:hypothetical protein